MALPPRVPGLNADGITLENPAIYDDLNNRAAARVATDIDAPDSDIRTRLNAAVVEKIQQTVPPIPDGVVTSPQSLNMVLTGDRDYVGAEGDLVFLYETFRHFTVLDSLAEVTPRWNPSTRWTEQAGFLRHTAGTAIRTAQSLNAFDAATEKTDVEVVAKVRKGDLADAGHSPGAVLRGSAEGPAANGVTALIEIGKIVLGCYSNGTYELWKSAPITVATGQWVWIRTRLIGNQASVRFWVDGTAEPDTWQLTHTITTQTALQPGWVGVLAAAAPQLDFADFGVATLGDTAPKAAL